MARPSMKNVGPKVWALLAVLSGLLVVAVALLQTMFAALLVAVTFDIFEILVRGMV